MFRYLLLINCCLLLIAFPAQAQEIPQYQVSHILGRGIVSQVEWQPNHERLAISSSTGIWFYNADFELERTFRLPEQALTSRELAYANLAWSPDGNTLAIGTDYKIGLWDSESDDFRILWEGSTVTVRWSPNGEFIAFVDSDGKVHLIDVASATELAVWNMSLYQIEWNFDGTKLLGIHSHTEGSRLIVWDSVLIEEVAELRIPNSAIGNNVLWNPSRNLIAIAAEELILWDVESDEQTIIPIPSHDELLTFAWSPDGQSLAIGTDRHLLIANLETDEQLSFDYRQGVRQLVWSPQGDRLAVNLDGGPNHDVQILNTSNWQLEMQLSHTANVYTILWDTSGQYLLTRSFDSDDAALRGWDMRTGNLINTIYEHFRIPNEPNIAWSPDSSQIALNPFPYSAKFAFILDAQTSLISQIVRTENMIMGLDWNVQNGLLAILSHETNQYRQDIYQVSIWNPQNQTEVTRLEGRGSPWVVKWNPEGTALGLLVGDYSLVLWDISGSEPEILLEGNVAYRIDDFDWSPDGTRIALATTPLDEVEGIDVIDAADGHLVLELSSSDEPRGLWPRRVDWSPSGDVITGAITDLAGRGTQIFWDVNSREIIGGRGYGTAFDWHPSGEYVALNINPDDTGEGDPQNIYLVNPYDNSTVAVLESGAGHVYLLLWSPDGRKLLSTDSDGLDLIWEQRD
jgi:WD40 repeat protein